MTVPLFFAVLPCLFFGTLAIYFSMHLPKEKKEVHQKEDEPEENVYTKLRALVKTLADGVIMVDTSRNLFFINDTAKKLLAIESLHPTLEDVSEKLAGKYDIATKIAITLEKKLPTEEKEVTIGEKTMQIIIHPVIDGDAYSSLGASVLLHDITLEKELAHHKEDFTNAIVHEMRAPLTAIKGASELIMNQNEKLTSDEQKKMLQIISEQSKRLLTEVSTLLDAAKLESGKFTITKTTSSIADLLNDRVEFFMAEALQKHIALTKEIQPNLPELTMDSFRVGQVMNNLLSNSLKFTPPYGQITVGAKKQQGSILVWVSDTGIGIPKDKQIGLFSKFYQIKPSHKPIEINQSKAPESHGTGLGLYILKGIVDAHGGKVMIASEENQGTTISFTLPLSENQTQNVTHEEILREPMTATLGRTIN